MEMHLTTDKYTSFIEFCSRCSFVCLVFYFMDILLFGTGTLTKIGFGISTRELFFGFAILFSLPLIFAERKRLVKNPFLWLTAIFLVVVVIGAVRGYFAGNSLAILRGDLFGFCNFLLLVTMICLCAKENRIHMLAHTIIIVCVIFSVLSVIFSFFALWPESIRTVLYDFFEDNGLLSLTFMGERGTRVFPINAVRYYFIAFLLATYYFLTAEKRRSLYFIAMCLLILALFLSYTRAFYLSAVLCVLSVLFFVAFRYKKYLKRLLFSWTMVLVIIALSISFLSYVQEFNMFSAIFSRVEIGLNGGSATPGEGNDPSNSAAAQNGEFDANQNKYIDKNIENESIHKREIKLAQLSSLIEKNPVAGNGLGAAIAYDNGLVEYFYHDILAKLGMVGLVSFLLPFIYGIFVLFRDKSRTLSHLFCCISTAGLLYFVIISYFNPCLNSTVGISFYLFVMAVISQNQEKEKIPAQ